MKAMNNMNVNECKWFACVHARRDGCDITGYVDKEGPLNGSKENCPHYKVPCISAKCKYCAHNGCNVCINSKMVKSESEEQNESC